MELAVAPPFSGQMITSQQEKLALQVGKNRIKSQIKIVNARLWDVDDPYFIPIIVRVRESGSNSSMRVLPAVAFVISVFENGYFRLNGKRLFLKGSHTGNSYPIGIHLPPVRDLLNRDLWNIKTMGFNAIRSSRSRLNKSN